MTLLAECSASSMDGLQDAVAATLQSVTKLRGEVKFAALGTLQVSAELAVFPGVPHALTPAMVAAAVAFLAAQPAPIA